MVKIINHKGLYCFGCKDPFSMDETGVLIEGIPYCSEDCFWKITEIEEFETPSSPTQQELAREIIKGASSETIRVVIELCELYDIDPAFVIREVK